MIYICKVYTSEFFDRLIQEVNNSTKGYKGAERSFRKLELIEYLQHIHNNQESESSLKAKKFLDELNLFTPEFTIKEFKSEEKGYQSQPRIMFKDKVTKIEDIDQIFSFKKLKS